ncbi:inner membrane protein YohK [Enterobacter hormaechei]|nr:inner membrane protein YohK [Enterobacter hormaechei]
MMANIWWSLPLTLVVFFAARKLAVRFKMPLLNPLLVAMVVIIPFLLLTGIPYERYFAGSKILNDLLQPAVVALAFPLYEQLHQIRARWKSIITICFVGSLVAMITGTSVALLMGASPQIAASILPKSVTTPIAMAVGGSIGGHSGHQRRVRDFRRYPGRGVWSYAAEYHENSDQSGTRSGDGYRLARAGHRTLRGT